MLQGSKNLPVDHWHWMIHAHALVSVLVSAVALAKVAEAVLVPAPVIHDMLGLVMHAAVCTYCISRASLGDSRIYPANSGNARGITLEIIGYIGIPYKIPGCAPAHTEGKATGNLRSHSLIRASGSPVG